MPRHLCIVGSVEPLNGPWKVTGRFLAAAPVVGVLIVLVLTRMLDDGPRPGRVGILLRGGG